MDSARWRQVERLFAQAMELEPSDRDRFLTGVCADDAAMREEIDSLLESAGKQGFADRLSESWLTELASSTAGHLGTPSEVGPYRIVTVLGQGGMGTVYLAERTDPQFEQQVALKLIRPGMVSEEVVARFLSERQILARLAHRNIGRLLDGGVTATGQPFFAMEYVVGEPVDIYADENTLSIDERLRLFGQVCAAVQYAHQNLVVHRDIKPNNILVTSQGIVKLLDFGIAKLLDPQDDRSPALTQTGRRLMTPDYASPEQVRGEAISTASDVYSLGVLLHRLLCGRRPYQIRSDVPHEIERVICEEDPSRPSTVVDRRAHEGDLSAEEVARLRSARINGLRRRLSGDLDTIVLKALQKDPARRYASAGQFLEDIERHLGGLPVHARPDTIGYRVTKFARRHRIAVLAAILVLLSLLAGITGTAWQAVVASNEARKASEERDRAQHESTKAERVSSFLIDLFSESDPAQARGDTITARQLLDIGTDRIDDYLGAQPDARATMMNAVGRIYQSLGVYDKAERLLEESLAIRSELFVGNNPDKAESIDHMGVLRFELGDLEEADSLFRTALDMRRRLFPDADEELATSLDNLGQLLHESGDLTGADSLYRESLDMRQQLLGPNHESIATSLNNLAVLMHDQGEYDAADSLYRRALEMDREVLGARHPGVAIDLNNLGRLLYDVGDLDGATALFEEALTLRRHVLGGDHPDVATSANNLAAAFHEAGDFEHAEALYREALRIREQSFGREHPRVAISLNNVASILVDMGDLESASAMYTESLDMRRRLYGNEHSGVALNLHNLGTLYSRKGDLRRAERLLHEAYTIRAEVFGPDHPQVAASLEQLGHVRLRLGETVAAEQHVRRALGIWQQVLPEGHPAILQSQSLLGEILTGRRSYQEAEANLLASYRAQQSDTTDRATESTVTLERLITLYDSWSKPEKADEYRRRLRALFD